MLEVDNVSEENREELKFLSKREERIISGVNTGLSLASFVVGGLKGYSDASGLEMSGLGTLSVPLIGGVVSKVSTDYIIRVGNSRDEEFREGERLSKAFPLTHQIYKGLPAAYVTIIDSVCLAIGYGIGYAGAKLS